MNYLLEKYTLDYPQLIVLSETESTPKTKVGYIIWRRTIIYAIDGIHSYNGWAILPFGL